MADILSADDSVFTLVQSPTEALQPQLTQDEPSRLTLSLHEVAVIEAKPTDPTPTDPTPTDPTPTDPTPTDPTPTDPTPTDPTPTDPTPTDPTPTDPTPTDPPPTGPKLPCKRVLQHSFSTQTTLSSRDESISAHVGVKIQTPFKFAVPDKDLRRLKRCKQNTLDKFNAGEKQTVDTVKEEWATTLALQLTQSNAASRALYQGVSESILNEICKSFGGGNEAAISITKKEKALSQIAVMIKDFVFTNMVQLVAQERQEFNFTSPTAKVDKVSGRYGKNHCSSNSTTENASSWSSPKCYSDILPADIVDRVEQNWETQEKTSMRCVADNQPDSKGNRKRCSHTCTLNKADFQSLVQNLSELPRPCEFSKVAKILTKIAGMAFCTNGGISHKKKARSGIHGLCQHFYQDATSPNRAEELKQLDQWLKRIVKKDEPGQEYALPEVPLHPGYPEARLQETTCPMEGDGGWSGGAAGSGLFLFNERSWYEDSGFNKNEFAFAPDMSHRRLVRYQWAIGKEHLSAEELVKKILAEPLSPADQKARGIIYVYRHVHGFGIVKIGHSINVDGRLRGWEQKCRYIANECNGKLQGIDREAPHPKKLEELIHAELKEKRRSQLKCDNCGTAHKEWFEVNAEEAQKVVKKWTLWMQQNPYDESGYYRFGEVQIPTVGDCKVIPQYQRRQGSKAKRRSKSDRKSNLPSQSKAAAQPTHDYALRSKGS